MKNLIFNYKPYSIPKKALYSQTGNEYIVDKKTGYLGWSIIEKEAIVIGEDEIFFVTELKKHQVCDTTDSHYGKTVLLPIGFHKSRLIEWLPLPGDQLELFGND